MPSAKPEPAPQLLEYMRADGNYTWSHYGSEPVPAQLTCYTLKAMIARWPSPLVRIHRSEAVNPHQVVKLVKIWPSGHYVVLKSGLRLRVASRRVRQVQLALSFNKRTVLTTT